MFNISPNPDISAGKINNPPNMFSESKNKWIPNMADDSFTQDLDQEFLLNNVLQQNDQSF